MNMRMPIAMIDDTLDELSVEELLFEEGTWGNGFLMDPTANDDPVDVAALMSGWGARGQALVDAAPADEPADDEGE